MKTIRMVLVILFLLFVSTVWSQNYKLGSYVIGGGGVSGAISANNRLGATVGQTAVDKVQNSQYILSSGFWNPPVITVGMIAGDDLLLPKVYELEQNYPNPFNPSTTINYALPFSSEVSIEIYNILGQRVRLLLNEQQMPGYYEIVWDGRNDFGSVTASGVYVYRMAAKASGGESFAQTRKMLFIR